MTDVRLEWKRSGGWARGLLTLLCAAVVVTAGAASVDAKQRAAADPRPKGPRAPRIDGERWFNSARLTPADLQGRVVLVEFWAFECINCQRTLPAMKALRAAYPDSDVVIVAVHTPELERERVTKNVEQAIQKYGITYPVAIDNQHFIWDAFENHYWPALYVIDRRGVIRHTHVGELHQDTEDWSTVTGLITRLVAEPS